jgi:hypothetical protein
VFSVPCLWVEELEDVTKLVATFEMVARVALDPTDTVALLQRKIEEYSDERAGMAY